VHEALIVSRFVHFASLFTLFGGGAFRVYAIGVEPIAHPSGLVTAFDRWFARITFIGAILALLSAVAVLMATTGMMAGDMMAAIRPATLTSVLSQTEFGHVWCGRLVVAALLVFALLVRPVRRRQAVVLLLSGLLLVSLGWVGHAADDQGVLRVVHELNQMAHLLAGAFWLGGLLALAWFLARVRKDAKPVWSTLGRGMLPRFSQMGYTAVAVIAFTGTVNSLLLVGSPAALFGTAYGRVLLLKICLFLAMVTLASVNRFRLMPLIVQQPGAAAPLATLARSVIAEQVLALAILAVVSVLGTLPPAIHFDH
jgi:putative copper resistance protein D